jgi:3-deoxy-D-manno-octulosonate 8-phosphate phosphatase (KDO 8-P phosphatase)
MEDIKAVALDVDGVLTDGTFIWGPNGEEYKQFSFSDVMDRFAEKMKIADTYKGTKDKAAALTSFAKKNKIVLNQICFMGDDVNDIGALELAGLSAAPANAHESVKRKVKFVTTKAGGNGAVRELIDFILAKKVLGKK